MNEKGGKPQAGREMMPTRETIGRRQFFKIVAASGVAAAAGCGRATEQILPYVVPSENLVPGVASWFSTVCRECPAGCGVIARNREGRVVKLEGNPDHPVNAGTLCLRGQSALQALYNPDRIPGPLQRDSSGAVRPAKWEEAEKVLADKLGSLVRSSFVELEVPHQGLELPCLVSERLSHRGEFFCLGGVRLNHLIHLGHGLVDLIGPLRLLLARGGDLADEISYAFD